MIFYPFINISIFILLASSGVQGVIFRAFLEANLFYCYLEFIFLREMQLNCHITSEQSFSFFTKILEEGDNGCVCIVAVSLRFFGRDKNSSRLFLVFRFFWVGNVRLKGFKFIFHKNSLDSIGQFYCPQRDRNCLPRILISSYTLGENIIQHFFSASH